MGAIGRCLAYSDILTSDDTNHSTESLSSVLVFYAVATGTSDTNSVTCTGSMADISNLHRTHDKVSVV